MQTFTMLHNKRAVYQHIKYNDLLRADGNGRSVLAASICSHRSANRVIREH